MKTINLTSLEIENIDGTFGTLDISKNLGKFMFQTNDLAQHCIAVDLFRKGEFEDTPENRGIVTRCIKESHIVAVQLAFEKLVKDENSKE